MEEEGEREREKVSVRWKGREERAKSRWKGGEEEETVIRMEKDRWKEGRKE